MASVHLRAALTGIPSYKPGRAAAAASHPTYKLSSNENPYPPLPSVLATIGDAAAWTNRYPDLRATALVQAIATRFDVPPEDITTGTGSVGVLQQVVQATSGTGDEVVYAWRSFEAYPIIVQISGATSVRVPLTPTEEHDLDGMLAAITDATRLVLLCSPNNPTGPALRRDRLVEFLDAVPDNVLVVIDEAYREFVRDPRVPDGLEIYRDRPNVAVLRTFSKAYGLAGLRVGFGVAHPPVAKALRMCATPFGVSTIAQSAAIASLSAEHELLERVDAIVAERERVRDALREQGWPVPPTEANFVWLRLGERTDEFAAACEAAGIVVRPFSGEGARCTIGEVPANDLLLKVAEQFAPT